MTAWIQDIRGDGSLLSAATVSPWRDHHRDFTFRLLRSGDLTDLAKLWEISGVDLRVRPPFRWLGVGAYSQAEELKSCGLIIWRDESERGSVCFVKTAKDSRRLGLAHFLLAALEDHARGIGLTVLSLHVVDSGAATLYKRRGYSYTGQMDGEGGLEMTKDITFREPIVSADNYAKGSR